jgi:hypothetical protein
MSKIKVIQIAMAANSEEWDTQYLDDKGRVWRQTFRMVDNEDPKTTDYRPRVPEYYWEQVDLPEEPKS